MSLDVTLRPSVGRCLAVWATATLAAGSVLGWLLPHLAGLSLDRTSRFDQALVAGCELAAVAGTGWLWVLVTLVVRDAMAGRGRESGRRVPIAVRRLVLAGCGLSLASGLLAPAGAQPSDQDRAAAAELLVGLQVPDRVPTTQWLRSVRHEVRSQLTTSTAPRRADDRASSVVVGRGDTLWGLAARTLPPTAGDAAVDRRWRRIYRANRSVVGADPHLILPGQRLLLPPRHHHGEE